MNKEFITIIGLIAAALTTSSFVPQVIKTAKSKSAKDLSWGMLGILWVGILTWLVYGLLTRDMPVVTANGFSFILVSILAILKVKNG